MKNKINNGITWLGDRFEFDAHYFVKNSFWLLMGQGMMSFSALIATVFLANFVSKQNLGDYRIVIAIYTTLTFFALPGIGAALLRSIAKENDGSIHEAVKVKNLFSIISVVVGVTMAIYFGIFRDNINFGLSILVASLCLPVIETFSLYSPYLQGKHEFKYSSINTGLVKLFSSLAVIIVSYFNPITLAIVSVFYISQVVITYIQYKILLKKFPTKNEIVDKEMTPYAKHITYAVSLNMFLGQSDKFILYHFFGPIMLAKFWIASTIPQEIGRIINSVFQVAFPKFVKMEDGDVSKNIVVKKFWMFTALFILLSVVYSVVAYPFFNIFFPQYVEEVSKSIVLMFAYAVVPNLLIIQYFYAKKNIKAIYINNIVDPLVQILLYIILIPIYGVWGVVFALLFKSIIMNIVNLVLLKIQ